MCLTQQSPPRLLSLERQSFSHSHQATTSHVFSQPPSIHSSTHVPERSKTKRWVCFRITGGLAVKPCEVLVK